MEISSKAGNIISRFPNFYDSENQTTLLFQLVNIFAQILEEAETDLLRVMRSHHVDTADNYGSQGIDAKQKGDLDKIFALYLEKLGGTSQLIQVNQDFKVADIKQIFFFVNKLTQKSDSLSKYIWENLTEKVKQLLNRYDVANTQFKSDDFLQPASLIIKLIVEKDTLTLYLRDKFSQETTTLLNAYDGSETVAVELLDSLTKDFNQILVNREAMLKAYRQVYQKSPEKQFQHPILPEQVTSLLTGSRTKDDIKRGNRLLLETVYPSEIRPSNIPNVTNVIEKLAEVLNQEILPQTEFYQQNQEYFNQLMLDTETQELIEKQQKQEKLTEIQLKRLNRLLLEAAYPLSIQKSYDPYRERLKALIKVLRRGAATKEGIRDIVAANLGIFDDDPQAKAAKQKIIIEEYAAEPQNSLFTWIYPSIEEASAELENITEPPWYFRNPNPIETTPSYFRVRLKKVEKKVKDSQDKTSVYLIQPRFINTQTNQIIEIKYSDEEQADEVRLKQDDLLEFSSDGQILRNGFVLQGVYCQLFPLPPGQSQWYFDAVTEEPPAKFNKGVFDLSTFDNSEDSKSPINEQQATTFTIEIEWQIIKQTPGIFHVIVPWYIEGFTDKFTEAKDHPRSQISGIINRVKAAGVKAIISYQQVFKEEQELNDKLKIEGDRTWQEQQPQEEIDFDIRSQQSLTIEQEMSDNFIFSGVFDYTEFDSGNRFN
ncbi:MAG: hypothetical protein AAF349_06360 [Cyanobacteria bacterium P01_A01_bin.68]